MEKVKVNLSFINKKGKNKNVTFFMDKQSYEMINSSSIAKESGFKCLIFFTYFDIKTPSDIIILWVIEL